MQAQKQIFISSTVYDLHTERAFVKSLLENYRGAVNYKCLLSEEPNFPIFPPDMRDKHSYDICINNLSGIDYVVLLLKQRYNASVIEDAGSFISITHREYREAFRNRIPLFMFVDQRTWDARNLYKKGLDQEFVAPAHLEIFKFIDEIVSQPRNNWIHIYKDLEVVKTIIETDFFNFDDSTFIRDVAIPDGKTIKVGSEFEKIWEIRNSGSVVWENRFLQIDNSGASPLIPYNEKVSIPRTLPNEIVQIAVRFTAPRYPGACESYWKMVDSSGRYCFPSKKGLFCLVNVVY